jgi:hypothetical protein
MIYVPSFGKMVDKEQSSDNKDNGTKWEELASVSNCGNLLVTKEEMVEEDSDLKVLRDHFMDTSLYLAQKEGMSQL